VDNRNRYFIVEMQMAWNQSFANRLVFNASKAFVQQFDKETINDTAANFFKVCPVYSLAIVNSGLPKLASEVQPRWYYHYKIADIDNPERVIEGLEFVVVELPKFKPETWSQTDKRMAVLWLRFLKELGVNETVAEELVQAKEIGQAISICEVGAFTRAELAYYDESRVNTLWDATYGYLETSIAEKDQIIEEKNQIIAKKDRAIARKNRTIAKKEATIAADRKALAEKNAAIAEKEATIAEKNAALAADRKAIAEKDAEAAKLRERIARLEGK
jgi:uncharacterized coiled-coil protein SlyX